MLTKFIDYMIGVLTPGFFMSGGGGAGLSEIGHALRLRAASSAYLSRTPGATTNRTTWTYSVWVKRGALTGDMRLLEGYNASNSWSAVFFDSSSQQLRYTTSIAGTQHYNCITTALFRDPGSFLHLTVAVDTTKATGTDRVKLYAGNTLLTKGTDSIGAQNQETYLNLAATVMHIGRYGAGSQHFDGIISRACFVDGAQLDPSSFGQIDPATNQWVSKSQSACKAVVDAGGANSFMLDFDDGTSLTTLGFDKSNKGNNWTLNNVSLTAGGTYDWLTDTPTNNYPTYNVLSKNISVLDNGNLRFTHTVANHRFQPTTMAIPLTGQWYCEVTADALGNSFPNLGIAPATRGEDTQYVGQTSTGYSYNSAGQKINNGSSAAYGATWTTNDVIGIAYDASAGSLTFYKNGVSQGVAYTGITGEMQFGVSGISNGSGNNPILTINFGQRPFAFAPPAGYKSLCTKNLPVPSLKLPNKHFDVDTWVGNGSSQSIANDFAPGLVWIKKRAVGTVPNRSHRIFDSLRGATLYLASDLTNAEGTEADGLTSFNSTGYTIGASDAVNGTVGGAGSYVGWSWKAGGAAVANNAGSINSQVSANVAAGFSIVGYKSAAGVTSTVGHGLGVKPAMILLKNRTTGSTDWVVYHKDIGATKAAFLDTNGTTITSSTYFNNTEPNSSVFTIGSSNNVNNSSNDIIAMCFAEVPGYSRIGSYTGNGSADGPFVWCGFRPRWVMWKRTDAASDWVIIDSARDSVNVAQAFLYPNLSNAEANTAVVDFTSNGFKVRGTHGSFNVSGGTYIFMAFAEAPFKYANAR